MRYLPIRNSARLAPSAVCFQRAQPAPDLAAYVSEFWQYDVLPAHAFVRIQVFPSACVVLRFNIGAHGVEPVLYGTSLRPEAKGVFWRGVSAFGVALELDCARPILGCDVLDLRDQRLPLSVLMWDGLGRICEELWSAPDFAARVRILSRLLRARVEQARTRSHPHPDLRAAVGALTRGERTAWLRVGLGVSDRTLRRHFDANVGLSPKEVERVIRLQASMRALAQRPASASALLASGVGFSDQAHMTREFGRLIGMSPGAFARYVGSFHEPSLPIWTKLNPHLPDPDLRRDAGSPRSGAVSAHRARAAGDRMRE